MSSTDTPPPAPTELSSSGPQSLSTDSMTNATDTSSDVAGAESKRSKTWWLVNVIVGIALLSVGALILIGRLVTRNDLPGCDSTRAKDTLSDIFKKNNVTASRYDDIKTLTTAENEITCNATLTLRDNSKLVIDYKLFKEGSDMRLLVTRSNP
jgi:hypothetical protein